MKIIICILLTISLVLLSVATIGIIGCTTSVHSSPITRQSYGDYTVDVITVENHKYIVYDGYYSGGLVHAASCPCLNEGTHK